MANASVTLSSKQEQAPSLDTVCVIESMTEVRLADRLLMRLAKQFDKMGLEGAQRLQLATELAEWTDIVLDSYSKERQKCIG